MNILFVHQNFPGQFRYLAPALAARGHRVLALCMNEYEGGQGVEAVHATSQHKTHSNGHPWTRDIDTKVIRGYASLQAALKLREEGFTPDVIVAHPGWGESLFLKTVWPAAKLGIYCEFHYAATGADVGFDAEFASRNPEEEAARMMLRNINNILHFDQADGAIAPTHWQKSTYPLPFRERISVIHEGIDTTKLAPNPNVAIQLGNGVRIDRSNEVVTFVNRNLEPYRGYHVFMRSLPELLRRRPDAHVMIVGGTGVSYGAAPPEGQSWHRIFLDEVKADLDPARVHFLGAVPYAQFIALLQLSSVHVYLTYPFVLSWSLLEAMSAGCAIVASDTQPLREAIVDGETGRLIPFFDQAALVDRVADLLGDPEERARLGANARAFATAHYDRATVCLPQQIAWVESLLG